MFFVLEICSLSDESLGPHRDLGRGIPIYIILHLQVIRSKKDTANTAKKTDSPQVSRSCCSNICIFLGYPLVN